MLQHINVVSVRTRFVALLFLGIFLCMVMPVHAWSDIGVEYYDDVDELTGYWDEADNEALEGGVVWLYSLNIWFQITDVDLAADVYMIRIDYDGGDAGSPENMHLYYRWGSSSSYTYATTFGGSNPDDFQVTITDASSTTLEITIIDETPILDIQRDLWFFGREPELWMYWY